MNQKTARYYMKPLFASALCLLFFILSTKAQVNGCTDRMATNYNSSANLNDGSCLYDNSSVSPLASFNLPGTLAETSGLCLWDHQVWTHNDNSDITLYAVDTVSGSILQTYHVDAIVTNDWEDISQDSNYLYIGDFGNNANGNRTDLRILRIDKNSLLINAPAIDTISFSYSDQTSFDPAGANNTDFDCEAFVVTGDSLYVFTKQWISNKTGLYALPKVPGTYTANLKTSFDVDGMVTGAVYLQPQRLVALCGYSPLLEPFIYLLYDFQRSAFFSGNKRKITISLPFHQVEGITSPNGLRYYLSNEQFSQPPLVAIPQKLHILDLSSYLGNYILGLTQSAIQPATHHNLQGYPNPVNDILTIESPYLPENFYLINPSGQTVRMGKLITGSSRIDVSDLSNGMYLIRVGEEIGSGLKVIKK